MIRRVTLALFVVLVASRAFLALSCAPIHIHGKDSDHYLDGARSLLSSGTLIDPFWRTPGYPLMLAGGSFFGDMRTVAVIVQQGFGVLMCLLVWDLVRRHHEDRWLAVIALALGTFSIRSCIYGQSLLTEQLFSTVVLALVWAVLTDRYWLALALASFAPLVRPVALLLALPVALFFRKSPRRMVAFLAVCSIAPGLWIVRNGRMTGVWSLTPVANVYFADRVVDLIDYGSPVEPEVKRRFIHWFGQRRPRDGCSIRAYWDLVNEGWSVRRLHEAFGAVVRETLAARFFEYLGSTWEYLGRELFMGGPNWKLEWRDGSVFLDTWPLGDPVPPGGWTRELRVRRLLRLLVTLPPGLVIAHASRLPVVFCVLWTFVLVGIWRERRSPRTWLLAGVTAYLLLVPALTMTPDDRLRYPVDSLMFVLAVAGLPRGLTRRASAADPLLGAAATAPDSTP